MQFSGHNPNNLVRRQSAYTVLELLVASSSAALIIASALMFVRFAQVSLSGISAQTMASDSAANAIAVIQSRIRIATSTAVDTSGNTLTLGFDDNYATDSDNDGSAYNDKDHYETFQFSGTNGTSAATSASNRIIYTPKVGVAKTSELLRFGVRNLPAYKIFSVGNPNTVIIRFGLVDPSGRDRFQSVDIQATGVSLNRPASSNVIISIP